MRIVLSLPDLPSRECLAGSIDAELANEMLRRGHEIYIHCDMDSADRSQWRLESGIQVIRQQLTPERVNDLRDLVVGLNPDLYLIFYCDSRLPLQYAVAADTGIPMALQECAEPHRSVANLASSGKFASIPEAFRAREAILADMHGIRLPFSSRLDSLHPIAQKSAMVFPNAFTPAARRADPGRSSGRKSILCVDSLVASDRDLATFVRAFARVAESFPDWDVRMIAPSARTPILSVVAAAGLTDRVILRDPTDDIYAEYEQAQLHVISSFPEDLPGVVAAATFVFVLAIGDFLTPQMVGGQAGFTFGRIVYSQFGIAFNWPFGAALSVILMGVIVIAIVVGARYGSSRRGTA